MKLNTLGLLGARTHIVPPCGFGEVSAAISALFPGTFTIGQLALKKSGALDAEIDRRFPQVAEYITTHGRPDESNWEAWFTAAEAALGQEVPADAE